MTENADAILALLDRRKNRAIRIILGTKERLYPDQDEGAFRKVVLDEINGLFEQVRDIVETMQQDRSLAVNQLFLDKLDELKDELRSSQVG